MAVLNRVSRLELDAAARISHRRAIVRNMLGMAVVYAVLVLIALATVLPFVWMVANSFKTVANFYQDPYSLWPWKWVLDTYKTAAGVGRVGVFIKNSFAYAGVTLFFQLMINSLCAYSFARMQFKGREVLFMAVLATMMLPGAVTLIPTYVLVYYLGLVDTFAGVVVPSFASGFGIFLLRQFFLNIPRELEDAAFIDGASIFRVYWQIILPLAKPALITLGIFIILGEWQSFIWPLVVLNDQDKYPITVGLSLLRDRNTDDWPRILAGSTMGTAPLIVMFLLGQKFIIGGITLSGLKG